MKTSLRILLLLCLSAPVLHAQGEIPSRPEQLQFPPLSFNLPEPSTMRVVLENGVPVYMVEDHQFPLITVQLYFKGGQYLEPEGKAGLSDLTGRVWRTGGAGDLSGTQLDEELDFLAARLATSIGLTNGSASLNLLSKDLDRGLQLFMEVLLRPRFDQDRLDTAKADFLAGMKQRNDDTADIESREWNRLIYGEDFWMNRLATKASIDGISREDLMAFHSRFLYSGDLVMAVVGDFDRTSMLAALNRTVGTIRNRGTAAPPVPQPTTTAKPGVYLVDKPDVNQGRVLIGHLGLMRPVPEEFSLSVANDILGGGGFTSWIMSKVRSDEGLAYSAYSSYGINNTIPGTFRAGFQSKSSTCARAAQIVVDLIAKLRNEGISEKELEISKNSFIQTFPTRFDSAQEVAGTYAQDELVGRPHEYWNRYRDEVAAVTTESARQAALKDIHPDRLVFLVVGNVAEVLKGHPDHPEIQFDKLGPIVKVPLRDPMTLEPLPAQ